METEKEIKDAKQAKIHSKLSECGHGSAFTATPKGCIVEHIEFSGAISLTRLNRYQFPGEGGSLKDRNEAGREVLANMALFGISETLDQLDLRSGCELYTTSRNFQTIYADGQIETLDISCIEEDLEKSLEKAKFVGLEFCKTPVILEATETLKKIAGMGAL